MKPLGLVVMIMKQRLVVTIMRLAMTNTEDVYATCARYTEPGLGSAAGGRRYVGG